MNILSLCIYCFPILNSEPVAIVSTMIKIREKALVLDFVEH